MATIEWPICVLAPVDLVHDIAPRSTRGAIGIYNTGQIISSDAGAWKASMIDISVRERDKVLTWYALQTLLDGPANPILIPFRSPFRPREQGLTDEQYYGLTQPVPHSDGSYFSDATGYVGNVNSYVLSASANARAVSIDAIVEYGGEIITGLPFSIGERAYRVKSVVYTSPTTVTIGFSPPLREAVTTGNRLDFDRPHCRMRLTDDSQMEIALTVGRWGKKSVNFVEDLI